MKKNNPLEIYHQYTRLPSPDEKLTEMAQSIYRREKIKSKQKTSLILCSDYLIRKLNREYRQKDKVTDVLSFGMDDPDLLGEIYISLQRARVQANRFGISYDEEILRLFVHGLFHLQGYDHEDEKEREIMEGKERKHIKL